jgi:hypothetical protein
MKGIVTGFVIALRFGSPMLSKIVTLKEVEQASQAALESVARLKGGGVRTAHTASSQTSKRNQGRNPKVSQNKI